MKKVLFILVVILMAVGPSAFAQGNQGSTPENGEGANKNKKANQRPSEPERKPEPFDDADVKKMAEKCVRLATGKGDISLEMFPESAPNTVRNFLNLVAIKALDNTTFSRVVPDFVIQGGDLYTNEDITNDLKWRATRTIPDEPNQIKHVPGIISMARGDEPNTASSSFFILVTDYDALDGKFAAFGRVTNGIEIVNQINKLPVDGETPKDPVRIKAATIETCISEPKS